MPGARGPTRDSRFSPEEVRGLLEELVKGLAAAGVACQVLVVGGAALSFYYDRAQGTTDVDAAAHPRDHVAAHAARLAQERGLRPDWFNEAAAGFFPHETIARHVLIEDGEVRVEVAEPEYLLAMKLRACRPQKDVHDLAFLLRRCDVRTVDEAAAWLERYYPEEELSERDRAVVQAALGEMDLPTRPPTKLEAVGPRPAPISCGRWVLKMDGRCTLPLAHGGDCSVVA